MIFLKLHSYRGSISLEGRIPNSLFLLPISCNFNAKNEEKPMFMVLRLNIDKMQFIYKTAIKSTIKLCIFWHLLQLGAENRCQIMVLQCFQDILGLYANTRKRLETSK